MSDFLKSKGNSLSSKQNKKELKKQLNKALHQIFAMAREGQIATLNHEGKPYVMLQQQTLNELIQNGGRLNATPQQKEFNNSYRELLSLYGVLDTTNTESRENELFNLLDGMTFEFSEARMKKEQENIVSEYKKVKEEYSDIFNKYLTPQAQAGKLT